jgi:L-ascorbate metabolism protein UlaG (beta-lactamase superfamily)
MTTRVRYLGIAAYEVSGPDRRILVDPFLTGNPVAPCDAAALERPDVILVSHPPVDHLGDAAEIAIRTRAPVVCGTDSAALLRDRGVPPEQIRTTTWGIQVEVGGVHIWPVESHHWSQARLADGSVITGTPLGFVFETEPGLRVYHFGDSALFGDMALIGRLIRPSVGILGCTQPWPLVPASSPGAGTILTGEMTPDEAALAAELLGVRYALASHYVDSDHRDVRRFLTSVPDHDTTGRRVPLALDPGQTLVIAGEGYRIEDAPEPGGTPVTHAARR